MMHTEEEAKTKWCPMSRYSIAVGPAGDIEQIDNRLEPRGPLCIGSACMMWQWGQPRYQENGAAHPNGRRGYCGLARP